MAVCPEEVILRAIVTTLGTINGTGSFTYDLTGRIHEEPIFGANDLPDDGEPVVGVYMPQSDTAPFTTARLRRTLTVHVEGWVGGNTFAARQSAAWRLRYDIERALIAGTNLRAAIITAATALGTTATSGYNAALKASSQARAHGDDLTADALLNLHLLYQIDYEALNTGSA